MIDKPSPSATSRYWGPLLIFFALLATLALALWLSEAGRWGELFEEEPETALAQNGDSASPPSASSSPPNLDSPLAGESSLVVLTPTPTPTIPGPTPPPGATISVAEILENREEPAETCGQQPSGWVFYVVQSGDTVARLAVQTGATIAEITRVNCIQNNLIYRGTQILLPSQPPQRAPVTQCGPPAGWGRYTVQRGDTMFSLGRARGTTIAAIQNANCFFSTRILAGQELYLPPLPVTPTLTPPPPPPPPAATNTSPPPATHTATPRPTATLTPSVTASPPSSPTATPTTGQPPTPTGTPAGTTAAPTLTPTAPPSPTATATAVPPTATPTPTAVPPSATPTHTPIPPTATPTSTSSPATATSTPTATPEP